MCVIQFCQEQFAGAVLIEIASILLSHACLQMFHLQQTEARTGQEHGISGNSRTGLVGLEQKLRKRKGQVEI